MWRGCLAAWSLWHVLAWLTGIQPDTGLTIYLRSSQYKHSISLHSLYTSKNTGFEYLRKIVVAFYARFKCFESDTHYFWRVGGVPRNKVKNLG